jgi:D-glycerate 3-kinase
VTTSLDDFYLSRSRRRRLAAAVHPLLATRGVPGSHDVAMLRRVIAALGEPGVGNLPVFDKSTDEPLPADQWRRVSAPVDVLVLEGWCLGAQAESETALGQAVNELEAAEDVDGVWRRYVNDALAGPYAALWQRLHVLIYLQVPDMQAVSRWRSDQEQALPAARRMSAADLLRFIAHYERITRAMLADLPPDNASHKSNRR